MPLFESRLRRDASALDPVAYQVGPEWADTDCDDTSDWLSAAAENCPGIELVPEAEWPTVAGGHVDALYRWPDSGGYQYTAIRQG